MEIDTEERGLSLIPGPKELSQPFSSVDVKEIAEYTPEAISKALLSIEGFSVLTSANPNWWTWKAQWKNQEKILEFDMSCLGLNDEHWARRNAKPIFFAFVLIHDKQTHVLGLLR